MYAHIEQYGWQLYDQLHDVLFVGGIVLVFAAVDLVGAVLHHTPRHVRQ
jgi:hypothetical protein